MKLKIDEQNNVILTCLNNTIYSIESVDRGRGIVYARSLFRETTNPEKFYFSYFDKKHLNFLTSDI